MKKGLLSLLAVALTVVSCQNYDDQFESLTEQITQLSSTVAGLSAIKDQVTALQQTVNGLATTSALTALAGAVQSNATAIAAAGSSADAATAAVASVADQVTSVQASITAILADLENVATAADLNTISSTLAIVQADVKEILAGSAVINQNIFINNSATLEYTMSLVNTEEDDPNVIVNGSITVDVVTNEFTAAQIAEVNLITNKIATSLATVTLTTDSATTVNFNNLGFVDGALDVTGATNLADGDSSNDVLRTVSGAFTISGGAGGLDLSLLSSSGAITIGGASLTSVNLGNATAPSVSTAGLSAGHMNFPKALVVNTGGASVVSLDAALASDIDVKAGTSSLTISAPKAATIDIVGTNLASLTISTVATPAVIHADAVTSITEANIGGAAEFHIGAVTALGTSTIAAAVVNVAALATQSGTLAFTKVKSFSAPLTTTSLTLALAETVSLKSASETVIAAPEAKNLTLTALGKTTNFVASSAQFPDLVTLSITGAAHGTPLSQANDITVNSTVLKSLTIAGTHNDVTITGASALTTLNVSGFLNALVVNDSDALVSATLDHDHLEGADASYLTVTGNAKLTGVTTPNLQEIGNITIAGNAKLSTIALAAPTFFPVAGTYTISVTNNNLTGTYVNATAQSTTTAYVDTIVKSDDLLNIKQFIDAVTGSSTYTYHMEVDVVTVGTATKTMEAAIRADAASTTMSATAGSDIGINTAAELANVESE